jgi:hypothetical protein
MVAATLSADQFAYRAIFAYGERWIRVRRVVYARRPRRPRAAIGALLAMAALGHRR